MTKTQCCARLPALILVGAIAACSDEGPAAAEPADMPDAAQADADGVMDAGEPGDASDAGPTDAASDASELASEVTILSAFYGLDNGVPPRFFNCAGLVGLQDGMPIVLDQRVPLQPPLDPAAFVVHRESGAESSVACVTLAPARESEERRTILLIGEFGSVDDPPVGVEIVGAFTTDEGVNAQGTVSNTVTPLEAGPSIVIAERYDPSELPSGGSDDCPAGTDHVIKVTWDGGVTGPAGAALDSTHQRGTRIGYADGSAQNAFAFGDAGDGDNHVEYCMSEPGEPVTISVDAGLYEDPNNDPNVAHEVAVERGVLAP